MNTVKIDENKLYDFLDTKVKPKWIESCNSNLSGWVKRIYWQDDDLFITDNMSGNTWLEGDDLGPDLKSKNKRPSDSGQENDISNTMWDIYTTDQIIKHSPYNNDDNFRNDNDFHDDDNFRDK